jgi:DNA-binding NarL/FixJ family response regulator
VTSEHYTNDNRRTRVFITGWCDGLPELHETLSRHPEVDLVGQSESVADAAGALAGGHLGAVLHATRNSDLPNGELAAIREHTQAPVILLASGEASALLEDALDADVSDVLLLPQLTENIVFAVRKAAHAGRRAQARQGRDGRIATVFCP